MTTTTKSNTQSVEIVNREDELRAIDDTLYRLTTPDRLLPKQILEFNGIGGIGKSALLQKFSQACKAKANLRHAFIDFAEFLEEKRIDINKVVVRIVQQIDIRNDLFNQIVDNASNQSNPHESTPKLIEYLEFILKSPLRETPLVLIFDSVDEVDEKVQDWLVDLVEQTIDAGKILFALASKISLGLLEKPSLEKKIYSFYLKEFDQESTLRQLQNFSHFDKSENLQTWTKAVFRMTHGHPLANVVVVSEAHKRQYHPQHINSKQYEFARLIDQRVVIEKVFHGYGTKQIDDFRERLTPLSIPRRFNLVSMGKLIEKFSPQYALKSSWHYSNYIRELQAETSFVRYSGKKSAYTVDPILRSVFLLTLKNEDPKKFNAIHEFLIELYINSITDAKGTDKTKFFLEKIYHQSCLDRPVNDLLLEFQEFAKIVGYKMSEDKRRDARQQFIEEFKLDSDLNELFDEMTKNRIQKMFE